LKFEPFSLKILNDFFMNEMQSRFATLFSLKSQKVERADGGLGVWGKDSVRPHYLFWSCDGVYFWGAGKVMWLNSTI
jgi:hypothetical protein